jgi:quinoprotein glucose dehydrogenase
MASWKASGAVPNVHRDSLRQIPPWSVSKSLPSGAKRCASVQPPLISVAAVLLIGLALLIGGLDIIRLGGSWYYALAGAGLACVGVLIAARRREVLWLYGFIVLATGLWALFEVGLDGWKLMPRLLAPAVLGLWPCIPWVAGKLGRASDRANRPRGAWAPAAAYLLTAVAVIGLSSAAPA